MTTSRLGYRDIVFVLLHASFLSNSFPLFQLMRICGEQAENASWGENKRTTDPIASCCCKGAVISLPSHLFSLLLTPESCGVGCLTLCLVPFLLPSLHQFWHPFGSSLRWFSSLGLHKTIDVLWLTSFSAELVSYVSACKRWLNASASARVRRAWPPILDSGELPDMKYLLTDWLCMNSELKCVRNDWREFHPTSKKEDQ